MLPGLTEAQHEGFRYAQFTGTPRPVLTLGAQTEYVRLCAAGLRR